MSMQNTPVSIHPSTNAEPLPNTFWQSRGNFIAGQWQAFTAQTLQFTVYNPNQPDECLGRFPASTVTDVNTAVAAAQNAYPTWKNTPAPKRAQYLYALAAYLQARKSDLARDMTREMGKSLEEAAGDVQEAIDMALYVAGEGRRLAGKTLPSELPDKLAMTLRQPIGVCGLITPWNFPIAVPAWKLFPCLLAGNTAVWKPSDYSPFMAQCMMEAFEAIKLPAGVVNLVQGNAATGMALVEHPDVRLISFTGSSHTGAQVASRCGALLKRVSLELGGKNACIVLEDANLPLAARGVAWGAFGTSGQRCTATSRVFVQVSIMDAFLTHLKREIASLDVGDTIQGAAIGPLISAKHKATVLDAIQQAVKEGAHCEMGGYPISEWPGHFIAPTVLTHVNPAMSVAQQELFGPVLCIITVPDLQTAIQECNESEYGLSSAIYTENMAHAFQAVHQIEAGITYVNAPSIGAEVQLPFGGVKKTGNGFREAADTALDIFTEWKTVYIDYSGQLQRAQMDVDWA
jgi:alpha-ketoglutaric semialdehyde dehydrogenase